MQFGKPLKEYSVIVNYCNRKRYDIFITKNDISADAHEIIAPLYLLIDGLNSFLISSAICIIDKYASILFTKDIGYEIFGM